MSESATDTSVMSESSTVTLAGRLGVGGILMLVELELLLLDELELELELDELELE